MENKNMDVVTRILKEPIGWLEIQLPEFVMTKIWSYIETAKKNPIDNNSKLAGNISKSLLLEDEQNWFFQTVLVRLLSKYEQDFPLYKQQIAILTEAAPYCLNSFWVNFQKQHEFNPLHNHTGVFSFVIWVKIPTDWREQHALPISANSNSPRASDFEFHYTSMLGNLGQYSYFLNKKSEGSMLFFPAKLMHTVQPFYNCDEERISISGNICYDTSENAMNKSRWNVYNSALDDPDDPLVRMRQVDEHGRGITLDEHGRPIK